MAQAILRYVIWESMESKTNTLVVSDPAIDILGLL